MHQIAEIRLNYFSFNRLTHIYESIFKHFLLFKCKVLFERALFVYTGHQSQEML